MRRSTVLSILACLAAGGCSTVSGTLSTDVWLCAYQLGDRFRDEAAKPDVIAYDTVTSTPIRRTTLTYLQPVEGQPPTKRTLTCDSAPWGYGVVAEDGIMFPQPLPAIFPGVVGDDPTVQGRTADRVRDAVRETGLHVHIGGIPEF